MNKLKTINPLVLIAGLGCLSVFGVVFLFAISSLLYWNSLDNQGNRQENQLNAQYLDNQNYLSTYISGFYEQVGLANAQSDVLNSILLDAVKGRYDGKLGQQDSGSGSLIGNILVIREAYPNVDVLLKNWGEIQVYVRDQREGYRLFQSKLLDQIRVYEDFMDTGNPMKKLLLATFVDFPSNDLEARIGTKVIRGEAALEQMKLIVNTESTLEAYQDGTLEPLKVPTRAGQ